MSAVKTVYVPRVGSQQDSSQTRGPQVERTVDQEPPSQCPRSVKRGKKRASAKNTRCLLKVKLPKLSSTSWSAAEDKTATRWMLPAGRSTAAVSGETEPRCHVTAAAPGAAVDVFCFSQRPCSKAADPQEEGTRSVLRTISKMLEENQLIRQRLAALSQTN